MKTPIERVGSSESARWRRPRIAETFASVRVSAPCYRFAECVGFLAIVKSELKLRKIQRQVFLADTVIAAHDSAFEQQPERFNRIGVKYSNPRVLVNCGILSFPCGKGIRRLFTSIALQWRLCWHRLLNLAQLRTRQARSGLNRSAFFLTDGKPEASSSLAPPHAFIKSACEIPDWRRTRDNSATSRSVFGSVMV